MAINYFRLIAVSTIVLLAAIIVNGQTATRITSNRNGTPTVPCLAGLNYVSIQADGLTYEVYTGKGSPCKWTPIGQPPSYAIASFPTATAGRIVITTDGTSATDCTVGSGSNKHLCFYNGSSWAAIGGSGTVTTTGSPASGNIAKFSGATSITNATPGTDYVAPGAVPISAPVFGQDAGATDAYACSLSPTPTLVTGTHYRFKANTANTGAATINFNSLGAVTIKKVAGGITTDLADNDIRVGQWIDLIYDGSNMQMQSTLGNVAASGANTALSNLASVAINDHLLFGSDNSKDIGASAATRPRTGFFGTSVVAPLFLSGDGTEANPAHSFLNDPDTGAYERTANRYTLSVGATAMSELVNHNFNLNGVGSIGFTFGNTILGIAPNTSIYPAASGVIGFGLGGQTTGGSWTAANGILTTLASDATHTDNTVCVDSSSGVLYKGSATLGICLGTSSARFKHGIQPMGSSLRQMMALRPVSFFYNKGYGDGGAKRQFGFTAEDVNKVAPELIGFDAKGQPNSVDLLAMVPKIISAMQEQQRQINVLKSQITAQQRTIKRLRHRH